MMLQRNSNTAFLFLAISILILLTLPAAQAAPGAVFTGVGPDDVMRALPRQRDAQALLLQQATTPTDLTTSWSLRLHQLAKVLRAIDRQQVTSTQMGSNALCRAVHWRDDPTSRCAPVAVVRHLLHVAFSDAQDYEKLRFPGIDGAFPTPTTDSPLQGGSFIGPQGSHVLLINMGTKPVRVNLGSWARSRPRLLQAWLVTSARSGTARLARRSSASVRQPVILPPQSISLLG